MFFLIKLLLLPLWLPLKILGELIEHSGRHSHHQRRSNGDGDGAKALFWLIVAVVWLAYAAIALPLAGLLIIAPRTRPAARSVVRSLNWSKNGAAQRRQLREQRAASTPQAIAAREAAEAEQAARWADHNRRTYRATITGCHIDPVTGGSFQVTAPDRPTLDMHVQPDIALEFLSLRSKDVVEVTVTPDGQGVEAFWHLARASGAKPRNPADFPEGFRATAASPSQESPGQ